MKRMEKTLLTMSIKRRFGITVSCTTVFVALAAGLAHAQSAVHGMGTTGTIPVWTNNSSSIGNSVMKQSGGNVNVAGGLITTGPISAPSLSGNGSGVTNVNAAMLGGSLPSAFAKLAAPNIFTVDQTINTNLTLGSNLTLGGSINNSLTLQVALGTLGDESANVIGGFGGNGIIPGNSVGNTVLGATIAGGGGSVFDGISVVPSPNVVNARWGTVGGGYSNTAGSSVSAQNEGSTVGGGSHNTASGNFATVSGGTTNAASGTNATVPGGNVNIAGGFSSFAAGSFARANSDNTFVWSDGSAPTYDTGPNTFVALASGGFTFYTASNFLTGATLASGSGSWSMLSDRNVKANFGGVDGQSLLAKLATLPINTWNYKAQPDSVRHMGPTAQDFRTAFGLGEDERHISTVDAQGVALAAIQALYETVTEQKQQIVELRARLAHLEQHQ